MVAGMFCLTILRMADPTCLISLTALLALSFAFFTRLAWELVLTAIERFFVSLRRGGAGLPAAMSIPRDSTVWTGAFSPQFLPQLVIDLLGELSAGGRHLRFVGR